MGGEVGGCSASDGRQTCGAEVVIVVLMVVQDGEGRCEGPSLLLCLFNDSAE